MMSIGRYPTLPFAAALAALSLAALAGERAWAGRSAQTTLRCESNASGELSLVARGIPITDALAAAASESGFEVTAETGVKRPLLTVTVPSAPLEDFLHELLRGRNYALLYDAETNAVTEVILLAPSSPSAARPARKPPRQKASKKADRGALVVKN